MKSTQTELSGKPDSALNGVGTVSPAAQTLAQSFAESLPGAEDVNGLDDDQVPIFPAKVRKPPVSDPKAFVDGLTAVECRLNTGAVVVVWGEASDPKFMDLGSGQVVLLQYDSQSEAYGILRIFPKQARSYEWTSEQLTDLEALSTQVAGFLATCTRNYEEAIAAAYKDRESPPVLDSRTLQAGGVTVMIQAIRMHPSVKS